MFNIGFSELLLIAVVALFAIGPGELPGVMRKMGVMAGKARRFMAGIWEELDETRHITDLEGKRQKTYDITGLADKCRTNSSEQERP